MPLIHQYASAVLHTAIHSSILLTIVEMCNQLCNRMVCCLPNNMLYSVLMKCYSTVRAHCVHAVMNHETDVHSQVHTMHRMREHEACVSGCVLNCYCTVGVAIAWFGMYIYAYKLKPRNWFV